MAIPRRYSNQLQNQEETYARREHNNEDQGGITPRSIRVDFPRFDGNDPSKWLYKVE
jgi:hypothetical protein